MQVIAAGVFFSELSPRLLSFAGLSQFGPSWAYSQFPLQPLVLLLSVLHRELLQLAQAGSISSSSQCFVLLPAVRSFLQPCPARTALPASGSKCLVQGYAAGAISRSTESQPSAKPSFLQGTYKSCSVGAGPAGTFWRGDAKAAARARLAELGDMNRDRQPGPHPLQPSLVCSPCAPGTTGSRTVCKHRASLQH